MYAGFIGWCNGLVWCCPIRERITETRILRTKICVPNLDVLFNELVGGDNWVIYQKAWQLNTGTTTTITTTTTTKLLV